MFRVVKFSRYVIVHAICHVSLNDRIKRKKKRITLRAWAACALHSADEPQEGRNSCPLLQSYLIGSCHVGVSKRFSRSINLAVYCLIFFVCVYFEIIQTRSKQRAKQYTENLTAKLQNSNQSSCLMRNNTQTAVINMAIKRMLKNKVLA